MNQHSPFPEPEQPGGRPEEGPSGGPARSGRNLPAAFAAGEGEGDADDVWRIEGSVLIGRGVPLAIRLPGAVLARCELHEELDDLTAELGAALTGSGLQHVEARTVLGHVIAIEVSGVRGAEWDLWAPDPETGHAAVRTRALGEVAEHIDPDEPARRAQEEETLRQMERDLWS